MGRFFHAVVTPPNLIDLRNRFRLMKVKTHWHSGFFKRKGKIKSIKELLVYTTEKVDLPFIETILHEYGFVQYTVAKKRNKITLKLPLT